MYNEYGRTNEYIVNDELCYLYKMLINLLQLIENYIHGVYHGDIEHQQNKRSAISCVFLHPEIKFSSKLYSYIIKPKASDFF